MPSIDSASRLWRARSRAPLGRGRSGWIAWLITALLCVQMWGLQHEIAHARQLSFVGQHLPTQASATQDAHDADDDSGAAAVTSTPRAHTGFGTHHHHCHLFEGATLAAAMAVAVLEWTGATDTAVAPLRANERSHASAVLLPFDSRAPPVAV